MNILLKKIVIKNFKGIQSFDITLTSHETSIYGANGTCKTSVFDAYCWLLFGKDSEDKKDFNIKPLDLIGKTNADIETSVTAYLDVDGLDITLQRVYSEKWTKPRGKLEREFSGNESSFFYNEVPLKENEYKAKVANIIDEKLFKLLSNPLYFNSLKWEEKRQILIGMAPTVESEKIIDKIDNIQYKGEVDKLIGALNAKKSIVEFKAEIASKKKTIKKELDDLPARIDEATNSLPLTIPNFTEVQQEIDTLNTEIVSIDTQISDKSKLVEKEFEAIKNQQQEKFKLESELQTLINNQSTENSKKVNADKAKVTEKQNVINVLNNEIVSLNERISRNNNTINNLTEENNSTRTLWETENAKELIFDENQFKCPACNRDLEEDNIETQKQQLAKTFNENKSRKLNGLKELGLSNKAEIEKLNSANNTIKPEIDIRNKTIIEERTALDVLLVAFNNRPTNITEDTTEIKLLKDKIAKFIINETPKVDVDDLKIQKATINGNVDVLKAQLALKDSIARINERIRELKKNQSIYGQELTNLEKQEFVIDNYNRAYMNEIEQSVNKMFTQVKFKMFEIQVNGGENPTCICTSNGVPFSDRNTAGKIYDGIDIINGLSKYYNSYVPMFLDNRESVTEIPSTDAQIINLIVSPEHTVLTVKS